MATAVNLKNSITGQTKVGYFGFSWTTLFFGFFPALFRGDFIIFIFGMMFSIITSIAVSLIGSKSFFNDFFPKIQAEDFISFFFLLFLTSLTFLVYLIPIMLLISAIWAFMYNKYYTRKLIEKGYVLNDSPEINKLAEKALGISPNPNHLMRLHTGSGSF